MLHFLCFAVNKSEKCCGSRTEKLKKKKKLKQASKQTGSRFSSLYVKLKQKERKAKQILEYAEQLSKRGKWLDKWERRGYIFTKGRKWKNKATEKNWKWKAFHISWIVCRLIVGAFPMFFSNNSDVFSSREVGRIRWLNNAAGDLLILWRSEISMRQRMCTNIDSNVVNSGWRH